MIRDVEVTVSYNNLDGTAGAINMTVTGEQLEQTLRRRMQTLMPRTTNYKFTEHGEQLSLQAEASKIKGAK